MSCDKREDSFRIWYILHRAHYILQPGKETRHFMKDVTVLAVHGLGLAHHAGEEEDLAVQGEDRTAGAEAAVCVSTGQGACHLVCYLKPRTILLYFPSQLVNVVTGY